MRKAVLLSFVAATLPLSAAALPADGDFAAQFGHARDLVYHETGDQKSLFHRATQESGPDDPLLLMQSPLINLVKKVEPSVVFLEAIVKSPDGKKGHAICAGFFVDAPKGRRVIATNSHCVEMLDVGAEIGVGLYDGNDNRPLRVKGRILAYGDSKAAKDIALVELVDPGLNRPALPLWERLSEGEQVVAIGNPHGYAFTVTHGVVSALDRDRVSTQFVLSADQTDVAVNPGNSGGPLFNMWGSVVGINAMIESESGGSEGLSFTVPAHFVGEALRQFSRTGNLKLGSLSITLGPDQNGKITIQSVAPGGPAETAGIQTGDQVVSVDGIAMNAQDPSTAMTAFLTHVKYMSPGETVRLVLNRGGVVSTVAAVLGEAQKAAEVRPKWAPLPDR